MMKFTNYVWIVSLLAITSTSCATPKKYDQRELVFIHGANFNSGSWLPLLQKLKTHQLVAVDLPGRADQLPHREIDLTSSAEFLCQRISQMKKPVLVAHSQGGAVLHHALGICPKSNIEAIVYVSAVVPQNGETPFQHLSKQDERNYFLGISFLEEQQSLVISSKEKFLKSFAPKASLEERSTILSSAVSEPALIGAQKVIFDEGRLDRIKKYYVHTAEDKIISFETQLKIISRFKFEDSFILKSSHLPMITNAKELGAIIEDILQ